MLDLKDVIENISKKIFITIIIVQVVILAITIIVFSSNTKYVYQGMKTSFENEVLKQSEIFKNYLTQKYRLLLVDLGFVTRYLQAIRYETASNIPDIFQIDNNLKNSSCSIFANEVPKNLLASNYFTIPRNYTGPKREAPKDKLIFTRWSGRDFTFIDKIKYEDKLEIYNICKIHGIAVDIVSKHFNWSDISTVNIDFLHFSYGTGLYMQLPVSYNIAFDTDTDTYVDQGRGNIVCARKENDYDPRCRPFYTHSYSENIPGIASVFISPYIFVSGAIGSEICVKAFDNRPNVSTKIPNLLSCFIYNFRDLDLIVGLTSNLLFREKLFLTYYKPRLNIYKISTIYHAGFPQENYRSFTTLLDIKSNLTGNYLTPDDLFENIYSDLFIKAYTKLNTLNNTLLMQKFRDKVIEINKFYNERIFPQISNLTISLNDAKYVSDEQLLDIISNPSKGFFQFNETWVFDEKKNEIVTQSNTTFMYYIPIKINASLRDDFSLGSDQMAEFYIMYFRSESVSIFFFI